MSRIYKRGVEQDNPMPMSDWQRERMEPGFADDDRAEHWSVSLALWIFLATVLVVPYLIFA